MFKPFDFTRIQREGERWHDLVNTFGAKEVLFIGTRDSNDLGGLKWGEFLASHRTLDETLQQSPGDVNLDKLMRKGSDSLFQELKRYLLQPEVQFKETCHRLSGLYEMVVRLKDLEGSIRDGDLENFLTGLSGDNEKELRRFLASEITNRITEVLGEPLKKRYPEDVEAEKKMAV